VLSRYSPPTETGVLYVPNWNEEEAGKTVATSPVNAIGKAPAKEDLMAAGGARCLEKKKLEYPVYLVLPVQTYKY